MIICYNKNMENFGEKLKDLRKERGWTQKKLAVLLGQAQSTIFYWEQNRQEPTISSLKKLCEVFDVSADYLLGITEKY